MKDTRFTARLDDADQMIEVVDVDDVDDLETLLMFLFHRAVTLVESWADDGTTYLDITVRADAGSRRFALWFPLSMVELARWCARLVDEAGPDTGRLDPDAEEPNVAAMADDELISALQDALGMVRMFDAAGGREEGDEFEDDGDDPVAASRGTCPSCGSGEVTHLAIGMPDAEAFDEDVPEWVERVGCIHPGYDRSCASCGATWVDSRVPVPPPVRLLSSDGAALALLFAPSLAASDRFSVVSSDIELLTPDRLVRYLARPLTRRFLGDLAHAWIQAAEDELPERTVPTVQADEAGLAIGIIESTPFSVTVEVLIAEDLEADTPEQDVIAFEVARPVLIDASHALQEWLK